ncbi:unnamed protein product [Caenorhabditis angaria]|uniref:C-type lectin domain-containing protein n=1 Tax=Caenorhabditis angaria TaxID=860376 RepID=A0A9P1MXE3_9PELO|nr:unnamed protein product [Caenorhabditis angaria]
MKIYVALLLLTPPVLATMATENCASGWTMVKREMGNWCIQVLPGTINVKQADQKCRELGAVLTGVENEAERQLIHAAGVKILRSVNQTEGAIWLGARRRTACLHPNTNATGCVPWVPNAYEWTDGFTTGRKMFQFRPRQPNYWNHQDRIYMGIVDGKIGKRGFKSGELEDALGSATFNKQAYWCLRGYACGKKPTITNYI